jgi:hypothetical protein
LNIVKYLIAMFLVAMALQPVDLQSCVMDDGQQMSHHAAMKHSDDSDCCDPDPGTPMQDCNNNAHCGFVSTGFVVLPTSAVVAVLPEAHHYSALNTRRYLGPPAPPLFRPPIA